MPIKTFLSIKDLGKLNLVKICNLYPPADFHWCLCLLASKVVKIDLKIIISVCYSKFVTHSVIYRNSRKKNWFLHKEIISDNLQAAAMYQCYVVTWSMKNFFHKVLLNFLLYKSTPELERNIIEKRKKDR